MPCPHCAFRASGCPSFPGQEVNAKTELLSLASFFPPPGTVESSGFVFDCARATLRRLKMQVCGCFVCVGKISIQQKRMNKSFLSENSKTKNKSAVVKNILRRRIKKKKIDERKVGEGVGIKKQVTDEAWKNVSAVH